ncbi:MAG: flagellar basal body-associated FliL family protein, partial [Myxococcota bacterium]
VPGNNSKLILILILANLVGLGGIGAYLVLFSDSGGAAEAQPEPEPNTFGPLIEVPTIIVNLSGSHGGRFMRVSLQMEVREDEHVALVEPALVPIQNRLLIYFSEMDPARTGEEGAKDAIAEELVDTINEVLGDDTVRRVYYTEFVIQ